MRKGLGFEIHATNLVASFYAVSLGIFYILCLRGLILSYVNFDNPVLQGFVRSLIWANAAIIGPAFTATFGMLFLLS